MAPTPASTPWRRSRTSTSTVRYPRGTSRDDGSTTHSPPTSTSCASSRCVTDFHARHDAVARSYIYQIARRRTAFGKALVWWVKDDLDVGAMGRAAKGFVGMHDFRAFSDDDPEEKSTRCSSTPSTCMRMAISCSCISKGPTFCGRWRGGWSGPGRSGPGCAAVDQATALLTRPSPLPARVTAPASGLFLERVYYPGDPRDQPVQPAVVLPRFAGKPPRP